MNAKKLVMIVIATIVGLSFLGTNSVEAQENEEPRAWTSAVCNGEAAIVYQSRNETGDGVTVSPYDQDECAQDENLSWFVVEPWSGGNSPLGEQINPDAGCLATSWSMVGIMARTTSWENGSAWRVMRATYENHPMVVTCDQVRSSDTLGLNPQEDQISPERSAWVQNRAMQLAGGDLSNYCSQYSTDKLARLVCEDVQPAAPQGDAGDGPADEPEVPGDVPQTIPGDGAQGDSATGSSPSESLGNSIVAIIRDWWLIALLLVLAILFVRWLWRRNRGNGHGRHDTNAGHNPTNHAAAVHSTRRWNLFGRSGHEHALHIKTDTLPSAEVGKAYTAKVEVEHASGWIIYSVTNAPTGLTINGTGTLSWSQPVQGEYVVRVKAQDDDEVVERNLNLTVNTAPVPAVTREEIERLIASNQPQIDYDRLATAIVAQQGNPTSRGRAPKASGQQ